jgi:5-methyltetrahydropteroyltriglutamate--homocysteine methyltransferase
MGFWVSERGRVQPYGARRVRPPVIFGDVGRPGPMTVSWTAHTQSLTGPATVIA